MRVKGRFRPQNGGQKTDAFLKIGSLFILTASAGDYNGEIRNFAPARPF